MYAHGIGFIMLGGYWRLLEHIIARPRLYLLPKTSGSPPRNIYSHLFLRFPKSQGAPKKLFIVYELPRGTRPVPKISYVGPLGCLTRMHMALASFCPGCYWRLLEHIFAHTRLYLLPKTSGSRKNIYSHSFFRFPKSQPKKTICSLRTAPGNSTGPQNNVCGY